MLAGSLLTAGTPVGASVRRRLRRRYADPVETARDAAAGAAWLAALDLPGMDEAAAARLHTGLVTGPGDGGPGRGPTYLRDQS